MRGLFLVAFLVVLVVVLLPLLRQLLRPSSSRPRAGRDELVKDPVCHTYVVRSRALARSGGDEVQYFCSDDCASRYRLHG